MLKKLLCLVFLISITISAIFADDFGGIGDLNSMEDMDKVWDGQKTITNKEFEEVMKVLEKKKNIKKDKKKIMKGNSINTQDAGDYLSNYKEIFPLLNLPVAIQTKDGIIPVGHYKIVGTKKGDRVFLNFCQAHSIIGKVEVKQTEDDFGEIDINFVKAEPYGNNYLKIMYGSMKFNAYVYLPY